MSKKINIIVNFVLYLLVIADMFLVNFTLYTKVLLIGFTIYLIISKVANSKYLFLALLLNISYKLFDIYLLLILSYILYNLLSLVNIKTLLSRKAKLILIPMLILSIYIIINLINPSFFLKFIQKYYYHIELDSKIAITEKKIDNYLVIENINYSDKYKNSYLDIYISDKDNPTYIYIHGGGYAWGDKSGGSSKGLTSGTTFYFNELLANNFNVVSVNYNLVPSTTYPEPLKQISEAIVYLKNNSKKYGINMNKIILSGGSAGGQLVGQFVNIQTNKEYAKKINITPVLNKEKIIAVVFNSSLLEVEKINKTGNIFKDYLYLQFARAYYKTNDLNNDAIIESNVIKYITNDFPPTYISDGNTNSFLSQAKKLNVKLDQMNVINYLNYYEQKEIKLYHGFEFEDSTYSRDNLDKQINFINKQK